MNFSVRCATCSADAINIICKPLTVMLQMPLCICSIIFFAADVLHFKTNVYFCNKFVNIP